MSILDEIILNKRREVAAQQRRVPISRLFERAGEWSKPVPFGAALKRCESVAIIAEIKRASPSAGRIREAFEPVEIAESYKANGATALSVLTDEKYFEGKLEYLRSVRQKVSLPVLRKDFMVDPYQVVQAHAYGADAILLIMSVVARSQFAELMAAAEECTLDCLVEVHNFKELERALSDEASLIGINNRDLSNFTVDLRTTEKLIEIIPPHAVVVSESGIKTPAEVERLSRAGIDAVLIGETLMRQEDVGEALREFTGVPKCSR
ncbi:MAG: indole-3-glycerol phosphate synthase TrpC [bacterium]